MKFLKIFKETIRKADFFKTSDLLRYRAECQYRTVFGGTVSIFLIAVLISTFYQKLLSCVQKSEINSIEEIVINEIPALYQIQTYPLGNFMLAISMRNFSLPQTQRFFKVSLSSIVALWDYDNNKWNQTSKKVPLQKCTRAHWKLLSRMDTEYDSWDLDNMFCLPMNTTLEVQGDQLSDISKKLKIQVGPCNNGSDPGVSCAQKYEVDELFNLKQKLETRIYMINTNINPSNKDYVQYIFNYQNILTFTKEQGSQGNIYVEDYEIQTDQSILPISMIKTDTGATLSTSIIQKISHRINQNSNYCQFYIFKSDKSRKYTRTFDKFDQILAYIGGLFGMLSIFLLIVNTYNNFAYEISLGAALFKPQDQSQLDTFKKYNFFSFILQIIYCGLEIFGITPDWKSTIQHYKCQKQMQKQLDIQYILNRLTYLETAISTTLEDHQVKGLHLKGKMTLKQAKSKRRAFRLKKQINSFEKTLRKNYEADDPSINIVQPNEPDRINNTDQNQETSLPALLMQLANNRIQLTTSTQFKKFEREKNDMTRKPTFQSDSSSQNDQISRFPHDNSEVMGVLNRLRRDSDKLSKKIWELTNKAIFNSVPGFINRDSKVLPTNTRDSEHTLIKPSRFAVINASGEYVQPQKMNKIFDHVIKKGPPSRVSMNLARQSRFLKPLEQRRVNLSQDFELERKNEFGNEFEIPFRTSYIFKRKEHPFRKSVIIDEMNSNEENS